MEVLACQANLFRSFDVVNNLFPQRKDSYSLYSVDGDQVRDIIKDLMARIMQIYLFSRKTPSSQLNQMQVR